jgi:hypothetical protein
MTERAFPKHLVAAAAAVGISLQAYVCFFNADGPLSTFSIGLFVWSAVPYLACLAISKLVGPDYGFYGVLACLLGDGLTYYSVFVNPTSSTAAIGLLFSPMVNLVFFLPIGMFVGHLNKRLGEKSSAR